MTFRHRKHDEHKTLASLGIPAPTETQPTIAAASAEIDQLKRENETLHASNALLKESVANLRSRLYDTRVQLDLARNQAADANARADGGRLAP